MRTRLAMLMTTAWKVANWCMEALLVAEAKVNGIAAAEVHNIGNIFVEVLPMFRLLQAQP